MVLLHTVSLQQSVRLPFEGAEEEGGARQGTLKVHGRRLRLEEGCSTNQSPVEKAPGAAPTQGSCNVYRGDMVMQLKLFFFLLCFIFLLQVDLNVVRKGRRTSERLLYAAFNTANKRE